jgi:hypothetical protein
MVRPAQIQKPERCLVCGRRHTGRCPRKALAAIDRANRRALRIEDPADAAVPDDEPSTDEKLEMGFHWMHAIADAD